MRAPEERSSGRGSRTLVAAVALSMLLPGLASAAPAPKADDGAKASASRSGLKSGQKSGQKSGRDRTDGKKVISLDDDFLVEGKLDKPSAFFLLRRSASDYDWARLNVELAPLVLESVQDPLF